ncbi:MAG: hypothetical protein PGN11_07175 [Quadrisphaera sp.]
MTSSSFFPEFTPSDETDDEPPPFTLPDWEGPPAAVLPGVVDLGVDIGRSDSTVVSIQGVEVYPAGVVLDLAVHLRETGYEAQRRLFAALGLHHGRGQLDLCLGAGGLRWGVELADGRRTTTLDEKPWNERPDDADIEDWYPSHPVMDGAGRPQTSYGCWRRGIWLWPLPPLPTMRVVCAWPDRGIEETSVVVSTEGLHAAAARARPVW